MLFGLSACGGHAKIAPAPVVAAELPKVKPEAQLEFEGGMRLVRLGPKEYERARERLAKAADLDGTFYEAFHDLGFVEAAQGKTDDAIKHFQRALQIQPGSRKTLFGLGEALGRAGRWGEAEALFGKRVEADPDDGGLRLRYLQTLRDAGKHDEALEQARTMLRKDGRSAEAYNAMGLVYYKMKKHDLAESALKRAAELDAKSAVVWNNLGLVALNRGRDQEAFAAFQKASDLDPKYAQARLNKAVVYLDCGDYKRAETELGKALDIDATDVEAHVALGVAARGLGKLDDARRFYQRALDLSPRHTGALYNLGVLYMDFQHDKAKAKEYFGKFADAAERKHPKRADVEARMKELQ